MEFHVLQFFMLKYFKGIEELFENRKHLVWFKDIKEMMELIHYYLKNENERKEIFENGRQLITSNYTYKAKAWELFEYYKKSILLFPEYLHQRYTKIT